MIEKDRMVKVINRYDGKVGYQIPDTNGFMREFQPREVKEITFEELEKLSYDPGGASILRNYLVIKDEEAIKALFPDITRENIPEYFYTEDEIKYLLTGATLDQFLDCLDFAPTGVIDMVKDLAVSMPLNDVNKREAIKNKLGFDVTQAIENAKEPGEEKRVTNNGRRAAAVTVGEAGAGNAIKQGRRVVKKVAE